MLEQTFNFGRAQELMAEGLRVCLPDWQDEFIFLVPGSSITVSEGRPLAAHLPVGAVVSYTAHYDKKTKQNTIMPWTPSQEELRRTDWKISKSSNTPKSASLESLRTVKGGINEEGWRRVFYLQVGDRISQQDMDTIAALFREATAHPEPVVIAALPPEVDMHMLVIPPGAVEPMMEVRRQEVSSRQALLSLIGSLTNIDYDPANNEELIEQALAAARLFPEYSDVIQLREYLATLGVADLNNQPLV